VNGIEPSAESYRMFLLGPVVCRRAFPVLISFLSSLDRDHAEGARPVRKRWALVGTSFESGCLKLQPKVGGKPHLRLNITTRPIANKYREGKLQRTFEERVQEDVKPHRSKRMELMEASVIQPLVVILVVATAVHLALVCVVSNGGASGAGWKPAGLGQCPDTL